MRLEKSKLNRLKLQAKRIRRLVVEMGYNSGASHTGSALSIVDILTILYFKILNINPHKPKEQNRDWFILSKGHASAALYATLATRGYFGEDLLKKYYCDDGILPGHIDHTAAPGLEVSSGSLGHGLSLGIGIALGVKTNKEKSNIFVIVGDGELNEGSIWEGIMLIPHIKLTNITLIVDHNKYQGYGSCKDILDLSPIENKIRAFGWEVISVDGHDFNALDKALLVDTTPKTKAIVANTVKGKGVSFMENNFVWHYKSTNDEEFDIAMKELR